MNSLLTKLFIWLLSLENLRSEELLWWVFLFTLPFLFTSIYSTDLVCFWSLDHRRLPLQSHLHLTPLYTVCCISEEGCGLQAIILSVYWFSLMLVLSWCSCMCFAFCLRYFAYVVRASTSCSTASLSGAQNYCRPVDLDLGRHSNIFAVSNSAVSTHGENM